MKTAHEYLVEKGVTSMGQTFAAFEIEQMLNEFAKQFKPKWIPFEEWVETAKPNSIVDTYSDVSLRQPDCEYDGESIEICGYDYYPGETKIWIMEIPSPPQP